jgi:hypothetical protein
MSRSALSRWVAAATVAALLSATVVCAEAQVYYTINGQPVSQAMAQYMAANGLLPGAYWYDPRSGNWGVVGSARPRGNIAGAGRRAPWSHYDSDSHFGVGGDSNGCIYAGNWSNC